MECLDSRNEIMFAGVKPGDFERALNSFLSLWLLKQPMEMRTSAM